jgi:hypothetical protein
MKSVAACMFLALLAACGTSVRMHSRSSDPGETPRILDREYGRSAAEVCQAVQAALEALEFRIDDDRHGQLGGTLIARRGTGDRITVEVTGIDEYRSRVVVRADPGSGTLASAIHGKLAERLGLATAKMAYFGGNSAEGRYYCNLSRGATAAEQVIHTLQLALLSIDVREEVAMVDARDDDFIPIRIKLTRIDNESSKAVFTVGTKSTPAARTSARRLKAEFERALLPPVEQ